MITCSFAEELQKTMSQGRWPLAATVELRDHVLHCRSCTELARVGTAFQQDRAAMVLAKRLESPSLLWWRAQLRRRQVAIETVSRPMWSAQIAAVAAAFLVAAGLGAYCLRDGTVQGVLKSAVDGFSLVPMVAIAMLLAIVGGVFLYLKLERD